MFSLQVWDCTSPHALAIVHHSEVPSARNGTQILDVPITSHHMSIYSQPPLMDASCCWHFVCCSARAVLSSWRLEDGKQSHGENEFGVSSRLASMRLSEQRFPGSSLSPDLSKSVTDDSIASEASAAGEAPSRWQQIVKGHVPLDNNVIGKKPAKSPQRKTSSPAATHDLVAKVWTISHTRGIAIPRLHPDAASCASS